METKVTLGVLMWTRFSILNTTSPTITQTTSTTKKDSKIKNWGTNS